ncbi:hypothetical protein [Alteraurantiacibacter buctensis]|uniref:hypothetical protein n=1 Tax=Alteraurantiacibacter buctensis TaxID=1503981 RepID=UPI001F2764D7|nr:hypothetical protein [Alteraurantiacibacter buctensis]
MAVDDQVCALGAVPVRGDVDAIDQAGDQRASTRDVIRACCCQGGQILAAAAIGFRQRGVAKQVFELIDVDPCCLDRITLGAQIQ